MRISPDKSGTARPSPGEDGVTEKEEGGQKTQQEGESLHFTILKRTNSGASIQSISFHDRKPCFC